MLSEYNTEYTRKHSAACYKMYHEDLNVTGKKWLKLVRTPLNNLLRGF